MPSKNSWLFDYANVIRFEYNGESYVLERSSEILKILPTTTLDHVFKIAKNNIIPHYRTITEKGERIWFDVREVFDFARVIPEGAEQKPWPHRITLEKMMIDKQRVAVDAELIKLGEVLSSIETDIDVVRFEYNSDTYSLVLAEKIAENIDGGSSIGFFRSLAHKGEVAHYRFGRRIYFDRRDVLDYSHRSAMGGTPLLAREPGEKVLSITEKFCTKIDLIRFDAKQHKVKTTSDRKKD